MPCFICQNETPSGSSSTPWVANCGGCGWRPLANGDNDVPRLALFGLSMFSRIRRAVAITWDNTQNQWIAVFAIAAMVLAFLCLGLLRWRRSHERIRSRIARAKNGGGMNKRTPDRTEPVIAHVAGKEIAALTRFLRCNSLWRGTFADNCGAVYSEPLGKTD